ncbi:MAG: class I SAM-dependent methyltransferase [Elusimicrobia bacterium]|nr:class I SAM-dependent methyltransferase [Elusimicrobiota bacterium]
MAEELFNKTHEYDEMLQKGLALSGESKEFFVAGRLADLKGHLPDGFAVNKILDFGCGMGGTTRALAEAFPGAQVVGADTAENALAHARENTKDPKVSFTTLDKIGTGFDLAYVNGVFHHIELEKRPQAATLIQKALRPGGRFAFFENNPWNPGTRLIMSRIPFDRDAVPIPPDEGRELLFGAGFALEPTRYLFFFPRILAYFRVFEHLLKEVPMGAQYHIPAVKE